VTFRIDLQAVRRADRSTRILALVLLGAFLLRLIYVLSLEPRISWFDGKEYSRLAISLVEGHGYSTPWGAPTAFWPPGYPFFLAAIYAVCGPSVTAVRLCEAILGVLICLLAYLIARECVGRRAGLVAAGLAAVYPLHIYMVGTFFSVTLQTTLVGGVAYGLLRAAKRRSASWALTAGVLGGWAVLTAASVLPALLLGAVWMVWAATRPPSTDRGARRRSTRAAAHLAVLFLLFLLPLFLIVGAWTARNLHAFGRPVLVSANGGGNFWVGNYPGVTAATGNRWTPEMRAEWFAFRERYPDEVEQDQAFYRRGMEFVKADPWRFVTLSLSKAIYLWHLWPQPMTDQGHPEALVILGSVLSYGVLLPPALFALGRAALRRRREAWLVLLFCLAYSAVHALYISKVRFRLPLDTFVIVYGAGGVLWILGRLAPGWRSALEDEESERGGAAGSGGWTQEGPCARP
jgi:4-amino-4-deoxy-L-arabinose transferase-like glycosyltransferase